MNPTGRYSFCLFHLHDLKPKQIHQIASSRAKTRPRQSQTCVKYRGNIIRIKRNTDGNTSDLKILHKKRPNKVDFPDIFFNFSKNFYLVCFNLMLDWRAITVTVYLAPWCEGHLLSVQCYDFLSSHNTLSVTHSDTASYACNRGWLELHIKC